MKWTVGSGFKVEFLSGCRAGFWAASKSPLYGSSSRRRHSTPSTEARSRYGATTAALGAHRRCPSAVCKVHQCCPGATCRVYWCCPSAPPECTGGALVVSSKCTNVALVLPLKHPGAALVLLAEDTRCPSAVCRMYRCPEGVGWPGCDEQGPERPCLGGLLW